MIIETKKKKIQLKKICNATLKYSYDYNQTLRNESNFGIV